MNRPLMSAEMAGQFELAATYALDGARSDAIAIAILAALSIPDTGYRRRLALIEDIESIRVAVAAAIKAHTGVVVG